MAKKQVVTQKHFQIFKEECEKWVEIFGLKNWCVRYYLDADDYITFAFSRFTYAGRAADIYLNRNWPPDVKITDYELKLSAFHEICEMLLYPIRYLGECRFLTDSEIDPEVHNVIRCLENVLWENDK